MTREKYIYQDGVLENGYLFSLVGRPINGGAERITNKVFSIGEDSAVILPEYDLIGVFDGAGGATDVGSAKVAALTAADAVD